MSTIITIIIRIVVPMLIKKYIGKNVNLLEIVKVIEEVGENTNLSSGESRRKLALQYIQSKFNIELPDQVGNMIIEIVLFLVRNKK